MKIYKVICAHCQRPFETKIFWAKYCSDYCRVTDARKRKKAGDQPAADAGKDGKQKP